MALARSLSDWEAPLDFLLQLPGDELYGSSLEASELFLDLPRIQLDAIDKENGV